MKTSSKTATAAASTIPAELSDQANSALSSAGTRITQGLQNVQLVQQARLSGLSRTASALQAQYGAQDPRVASANAAVAAATAAIGRLKMVCQQQSTPAPTVAAHGWALQGRVFTADWQPAVEFTVFLVDGQKAYQPPYGFAYTDSTGYFLLNYPGNESAATTPVQLFIQVVNQNKQPVYLSTDPFQPVAGSATYQNIILPAGAPPLGNPPAVVRRAAFPTLKKGSSRSSGA